MPSGNAGAEAGSTLRSPAGGSGVAPAHWVVREQNSEGSASARREAWENIAARPALPMRCAGRVSLAIPVTAAMYMMPRRQRCAAVSSIASP